MFQICFKGTCACVVSTKSLRCGLPARLLERRRWLRHGCSAGRMPLLPPFVRRRAGYGGDGGFVIEFGGVCYQDTYPMYLACILHVFRMYLDVIRSYTSRYTKIHQDTSRYICIYLFGYHGNVSYLGICILLYDTFKIHSRYVQDTMYLNPQIHDTQDTLTIHVGYIGIHSRIRISSPTCRGRAWMSAWATPWAPWQLL